ncbi:DUF4232 domain-containing protein [Arthrobacter sp. TB 23]|uniref:DUF4232 domain-containing protein n=1 Tax=Arthrobacter sp. TB 23 TaxID=494419 RepID=UPI00031D02C1|nr:DUF4232 domain-containing protein [Arthrobacter sp. TB 23]
MGIHTRTSSKAAAVLAAISSIALVAGCGASSSTEQESTPAPEATTSAAPTTAPTEEASESPSPEASATPTEEASEEPTAAEPEDDGSCTAADLAATVETPMGAGSAGTAARNLILSNMSDEECTMTGYPGVSYVDASEAQVGAPADREPGVESPTVVLAPGQSAIATLQQTNAQNYGDGCSITETTGVRVYPPGATDSLIAVQESVGCAAEDIILMTVGPVTAM